MRPCDDVCVTGRTRILLPPASWRRAQLRGHLRITANQHRHLRRTQTRAIESVLSKDVEGTSFRRSPQYLFASTSKNHKRKFLKSPFVPRGFSYRGHAAMPSVKWAIAIEKKNIATARKPRFLFRGLPGFLGRNGCRNRTQRGRLPQNRRPFLSRKRGCGGFGIPT